MSFSVKKAQVMIEYITYFTMALLVFVSLFVFISLFQGSQIAEKEYAILTDHASSIQSLFFTYSQMDPTFNQTIQISETINNKPYNFEILANNLYITQDDLEVILPLPDINGGTTNKEMNISVRDDGVYIN